MSNSLSTINADQALYEDRYVALLDILGFKDRVRNSSTPVGTGAPLASIASCMLRTRLPKLVSRTPPQIWKGYWFSDTMILIGEPSEAGVSSLLMEIDRLSAVHAGREEGA